MNLEFVDRTKKDGFIMYFKMRPEHFEEIFLEEATIENITKQFNLLQDELDD